MPSRQETKASPEAYLRAGIKGRTMSAIPNILTVAVMPRRRAITIAERRAIARGDLMFWPLPVPEYGKTAAAKKVRARNYWDAVAACDEVTDKVAAALETGAELRVHVSTGTRMSGVFYAKRDPRNVYATVVGRELLQDVCNNADVVTIEAGAEDPRLWIPEVIAPAVEDDAEDIDTVLSDAY